MSLAPPKLIYDSLLRASPAVSGMNIGATQADHESRPPRGPTSYKDLELRDNARMHAGDVHNVTNSKYAAYPMQALKDSHTDSFAPDFLNGSNANHRSSTLSLPRKIELAPADSPIHAQLCADAAKGLRRPRLEYLLAQGANVDATDKLNASALYYAAYHGDLDNVECLLEHGADINIRKSSVGTPISIAALRRHAQVVEILLDNGADISVLGHTWGSAMHCAFYGGDLGIAKKLLDKDCSWRNATVCLGSLSLLTDKASPLYILPQHRRYSPEKEVRCSPLFLAAHRCHFDLLQSCCGERCFELLQGETWEPYGSYYADVATRLTYHSKDVYFGTKASNSSAWSTLSFPLTAHLRANTQDSPHEQPRLAPSGPSLLMWAASSFNIDLIEYLEQASTNTDARTRTEGSVLECAAFPFADATFMHIERCFQRLTEGKAPLSYEFGLKLLKITVSRAHAALDPRSSYCSGSDVHSRCLKSVLDCIESLSRRQASQDVLLDLVSHNLCPASSVDLLCKYATGHHTDSPQATKLGPNYLHDALIAALQHSTAGSVIKVLLDHGADPNFNPGQSRGSEVTTPLLSAIRADAPKAIVRILLQRGADLDVRSDCFISPHQAAKLKCRHDLIQLFADAKHMSPLSEPTADQIEPFNMFNALSQQYYSNSPQVKQPSPNRSWFSNLTPFSLLKFQKKNNAA